MDRAELKTSTEIEKCVGLDEAEAEKVLDSIAREQLETSMDVPDLRISNDAGNFLCGFSYYFSLAKLWDLRSSRAQKPSQEKTQPSNASEEKLSQSRIDTKRRRQDSSAMSTLPQSETEGSHRDQPCAAFLHVPDLTYSDEAMEKGREIVIGLIRALVESKANVGVGDGFGSEKEVVQNRVDEAEIVMDANFR
jgi:hypothetical protein